MRSRRRMSFELPPTLVEREFDAIWKQVTDGLQRDEQDLCRRGQDRGRGARPSTAPSPSAACGLVWCVGEIGDKNKIEVTQDELRRALMEQARRFPGQEKNGLRILREDAGRDPGAARADLRGQGDRFRCSSWPSRPRRRSPGRSCIDSLEKAKRGITPELSGIHV